MSKLGVLAKGIWTFLTRIRPRSSANIILSEEMRPCILIHRLFRNAREIAVGMCAWIGPFLLDIFIFPHRVRGIKPSSLIDPIPWCQKEAARVVRPIDSD